MYRRLAIVDAELDRIGLRHNANYVPMLERLAGSSDIAALKVLADVIEPGNLGLRHRTNPNYAQDTPLNRLVDAARPDSAVARRFGELVDRYARDRRDTAVRDEIREWLGIWAANHKKLTPLIANRRILADAAPVSSALSHIASIAQRSLDGARPQAAETAELDSAQKPLGEVHLAVAPTIRKLAEASR
jgi:hexosaminidase